MAEIHNYTMNFGPQHPATHTTLRIVMKLDGERVVDAVPDIGYLHSGFEKLGDEFLPEEKRAFKEQGIPFYFQ